MKIKMWYNGCNKKTDYCEVEGDFDTVFFNRFSQYSIPGSAKQKYRHYHDSENGELLYLKIECDGQIILPSRQKYTVNAFEGIDFRRVLAELIVEQNVRKIKISHMQNGIQFMEEYKNVVGILRNTTRAEIGWNECNRFIQFVQFKAKLNGNPVVMELPFYSWDKGPFSTSTDTTDFGYWLIPIKSSCFEFDVRLIQLEKARQKYNIVLAGRNGNENGIWRVRSGLSSRDLQALAVVNGEQKQMTMLNLFEEECLPVIWKENGKKTPKCNEYWSPVVFMALRVEELSKFKIKRMPDFRRFLGMFRKESFKLLFPEQCSVDGKIAQWIMRKGIPAIRLEQEEFRYEAFLKNYDKFWSGYSSKEPEFELGTVKIGNSSIQLSRVFTKSRVDSTKVEQVAAEGDIELLEAAPFVCEKTTDPFEICEWISENIDIFKKCLHGRKTTTTIGEKLKKLASYRGSIPNIALMGPPGVGKTTMAKELAEELLGRNRIICVSAPDLRGAFVGHTSKIVGGLLLQASEEKKILYVDEAYDLVKNKDKDSFGQEAMATLLPILSGDNNRVEIFSKADKNITETAELKWIPPVWFGGYESEVRRMISQNSGMYRRIEMVSLDIPSKQDLVKLVKSKISISEGVEGILSRFLEKALVEFEDLFAYYAGINKLVEYCEIYGTEELSQYCEEQIQEFQRQRMFCSDEILPVFKPEVMNEVQLIAVPESKGEFTLICGESGTGKTVTAKYFSKGKQMFYRSSIGMTARELYGLFESAKGKDSIVIIDDVSEEGLVNLIKSIRGNQRTIVIGSVQADGFDEIIHLHSPTKEVRKMFLTKFSDEERKQLVKETDGFTQRELCRVRDVESMEDAIDVIDSILSGECTPCKFEEEFSLESRGKSSTAIHEMGHAIVALVLGIGFRSVSVLSRGKSCGRVVMNNKAPSTKDEFESRIAIGLGGYVAEEIVFGEVSSGASADLEMATKLAQDMCWKFGMGQHLVVREKGNPKEIEGIMREQQQRVREILTQYNLVESAKTLWERKRLTESEVKTIVERV